MKPSTCYLFAVFSLIACRQPPAGPAALAPADPAELRARVEKALRCVPGRTTCLTIDNFPAKEIEFPSAAVVRAVPNEDEGIDAFVIRRGTAGGSFVLYRYTIDRQGAVAASRCLSNFPSERSRLGSARLPNRLGETEGGSPSLLFSDGCDQYGEEYQHFRIDDGSLKALDQSTSPHRRSRLDLNSKSAISDWQYQRVGAWLFRPERIPIWPGTLRLNHVSGYGYHLAQKQRLFAPKDEDEHTPVEELLSGAFRRGPVWLGPRSEATLESGGISLRLAAGARGVQLDVVEEPSLARGWREARAQLPKRVEGAIWSPPFLLADGKLFRIDREGARLLCEKVAVANAPWIDTSARSATSLNQILSRALFGAGAGPAEDGEPLNPSYADGALFLPWHGGTALGSCVDPKDDAEHSTIHSSLLELPDATSDDVARALFDSPFKHRLESLRCTPNDGFACATLPDELGAVEDAFPSSAVLASRRSEEGALATVLRYRTSIETGVVFEYELDPSGAVLKRSCTGGVPDPGTSLAHARLPDEILEDRLVYWDRCTIAGACWTSIGRRVAFTLDESGALVDPVDAGPRALYEGSLDSIDCLFPAFEVPLPEPATVVSVRGRAWVEGRENALQAGIRLGASTVFLDRSTTVDVSVSGTTLRFESDWDAGVRVELRQDESLREVWGRIADRLGSSGPLHWAAPYLHSAIGVWKIDGSELRQVCTANELRPCKQGCIGHRLGGRPVAGNGTVYLPGPGAVSWGSCMEPTSSAMPPRAIY